MVQVFLQGVDLGFWVVIFQFYVIIGIGVIYQFVYFVGKLKGFFDDFVVVFCGVQVFYNLKVCVQFFQDSVFFSFIMAYDDGQGVFCY